MRSRHGSAFALASLVAVLVASFGAVLLAPGAAEAAATDTPVVTTRVVAFGASAARRPIRAVVRCTADASIDVLVIGVIHGTEPAGRAVVQRLATSSSPHSTRTGSPPARARTAAALISTETSRPAGARVGELRSMRTSPVAQLP